MSFPSEKEVHGWIDEYQKDPNMICHALSVLALFTINRNVIQLDKGIIQHYFLTLCLCKGNLEKKNWRGTYRKTYLKEFEDFSCLCLRSYGLEAKLNKKYWDNVLQNAEKIYHSDPSYLAYFNLKITKK